MVSHITQLAEPGREKDVFSCGWIDYANVALSTTLLWKMWEGLGISAMTKEHHLAKIGNNKQIFCS